MRKLALLAALAVAAIAMTATPALGAMEVRDATGNLCSAVSPAVNKLNPPVFSGGPAYQSGGCTVEMTADGLTTLGNHDCYIDYDLHVGPDGYGYADNFVFGSGCPSWSMGSRTVLPGDVNPYGVFSASDENTDFNSFWRATTSYYPQLEAQAHQSLDVVDENPVTALSQWWSGEQFSGGSWVGDTGLQISFN